MEKHVNWIGLSTQGNIRKGVGLSVFGPHSTPTSAFVRRNPPSYISIISKTTHMICLGTNNGVEDFERIYQYAYLHCCYTNLVTKFRGKWPCDSDLVVICLPPLPVGPYMELPDEVYDPL